MDDLPVVPLVAGATILLVGPLRRRAVSVAGAFGRSVFRVQLPDFRILPRRYITALPPSTATVSTTDHVCVCRSSARVTVMPSFAPTFTTRPSVSTMSYG